METNFRRANGVNGERVLGRKKTTRNPPPPFKKKKNYSVEIDVQNILNPWAWQPFRAD